MVADFRRGLHVKRWAYRGAQNCGYRNRKRLFGCLYVDTPAAAHYSTSHLGTDRRFPLHDLDI